MNYQSLSRCLPLIVSMLCLHQMTHAQTDLSGSKQYPQFRTSSGLPGGGFTLNRNGELSGQGAISLSIPVAYSLAQGKWVGGLNFTGKDWNPRSITFDDGNGFRGNGTAWLMTGLGGDWGKLTVGVMVLSTEFDNSINLLYTPPKQEGPIVFAVGVQDVSGEGGSGGEALDMDGQQNSRSLFGVATWQIRPDVYATTGIGTNRFRFGFLGANWNVSPSWSISGEHDGYNFNGLLAYRVGKLFKVGNRDAFGTLTVGTVRGKYLNLGFAFGF